jgi:hypothetical protein
MGFATPLGFNETGSSRVPKWLRYTVGFYGGIELGRGLAQMAGASPPGNPFVSFASPIVDIDAELHKLATTITPTFALKGGPDVLVALFSLWTVGFWNPTKIY